MCGTRVFHLQEFTVLMYITELIIIGEIHKGFPGGAGGKESTCQCRRCKR